MAVYVLKASNAHSIFKDENHEKEPFSRIFKPILRRSEE
jgi:hypothetical protein